MADHGVERQYQKITQLQHILLRPDTYIGSVQPQTDKCWVCDAGDGSTELRLVHRKATIVPGLYKIFDEILVNAADNAQRGGMTQLKVKVQPRNGEVCVFNDGKGIPVARHKDHGGVYVPELVFGHLLSSSNYDDAQKKTTGGRNGYGAKLANIFSTRFTVEVCDATKVYTQTWRDNMKVVEPPVISEAKSGAKSYTKVTFCPDFSKFGGTPRLDTDTVALFKKRVLDIAGTMSCDASVRVWWNGKRVNISSFKQYVDMYLPPDAPRVYEAVHPRWQVCVALSSQAHFQQVSFVNGICTTKGGQHVKHVVDQLTAQLLELVAKKGGKRFSSGGGKGASKGKGKKGSSKSSKSSNSSSSSKSSSNKSSIQPQHIKNHLFLFVNAVVENPAFSSQTKDTLTTRQGGFGSRCEVSARLVARVAKQCGVVERVLSWARFRQSKELQKDDGAKRSRVRGIPKLEDANWAGTSKSQECTLILTEGDSAKALAVSGLGVVGRDKYGVFPLKGKPLNVRDASVPQIVNNAEVSSLKQILGLQQGVRYESAAPLRYGHIMLMTDQDPDGSHIKGLLINLLHHFWPGLLKVPGFLLEFVTPIVKATHKGSKGSSTRKKAFFTLHEYRQWWQAEGQGQGGWRIKYYKGLGTSTAAEGKEYFRDLAKHQIRFKHCGEQADQLIDMAFSRKRADDRKAWLAARDASAYLDHSVKTLTFSDFVNKELVMFSAHSNQRAIPSVVDGLKPGQRKIMFACFKRNLTRDIKVAQLAGYVSEHAAYHHGEQSLCGTIVNLAQTHVGSNNVNLLEPGGQFGTRALGGKDAASARYIFTRLSPLARLLFPAQDDAQLDAMQDDGQAVQPRFYVPCLPMVLVNGAGGIGTGWSCNVPNYSPLDLVAALRERIRQSSSSSSSSSSPPPPPPPSLSLPSPPPLHPWYRGHTGSITRDRRPGRYNVRGRASVSADERTVRVTELPVQTWTQDYKRGVLERLQEAGAVTDVKEHHTDTTVDFSLAVTREGLAGLREKGLLKALKLEGSLSTTNMVLFDRHGKLRKYDSPEAILDEFYVVRAEYYGKRRTALLQVLRREVEFLESRRRFVRAVVAGEVRVAGARKDALLERLAALGFRCFVRGQESFAAPQDTTARARGFDYLLSIPLWSLTLEKAEALQLEGQKKASELRQLQALSASDLWLQDLDKLEAALLKLPGMARAPPQPPQQKQEQREQPVAEASSSSSPSSSSSSASTTTTTTIASQSSPLVPPQSGADGLSLSKRKADPPADTMLPTKKRPKSQSSTAPLCAPPWSCAQCTYLNTDGDVLVCAMCCSAKPADAPVCENKWACAACTYENQPDRLKCYMCSLPKGR